MGNGRKEVLRFLRKFATPELLRESLPTAALCGHDELVKAEFELQPEGEKEALRRALLGPALFGADTKMAEYAVSLCRGIIDQPVADWDVTPLQLVAGSDSVPLALMLLHHGARVDACNNAMETPLATAASWGSVGVMKLLLERGSDVNRPDRDGYTALHHAVMRECVDAARMLLESGANPNARTFDLHLSPLYIAACDCRRPQLLELLLKYGADRNSLALGGVSPLMDAAFSDSVVHVRLLLGAGACPFFVHPVSRAVVALSDALEEIQRRRATGNCSPELLEMLRQAERRHGNYAAAFGARRELDDLCYASQHVGGGLSPYARKIDALILLEMKDAASVTLLAAVCLKVDERSSRLHLSTTFIEHEGASCLIVGAENVPWVTWHHRTFHFEGEEMMRFIDKRTRTLRPAQVIAVLGREALEQLVLLKEDLDRSHVG